MREWSYSIPSAAVRSVLHQLISERKIPAHHDLGVYSNYFWRDGLMSIHGSQQRNSYDLPSISLEELIEWMKAYKSAPTWRIADHNAVITSDGHLKVGCTTVSAETIKEIAAESAKVVAKKG